MKKKFQYEICGKKYIQTTLVLGQLQQLLVELEGIVFPKDITTMGIISIVGNRLPRVLAIILTPEGMNVREKNVSEIAEQLAYEMTPDLAMKVIEDFFDCTPIASLLERIGAVSEKINQSLTEKKTGSTNSSVSLAAETSQEGT